MYNHFPVTTRNVGSSLLVSDNVVSLGNKNYICQQKLFLPGQFFSAEITGFPPFSKNLSMLDL